MLIELILAISIIGFSLFYLSYRWLSGKTVNQETTDNTSLIPKERKFIQRYSIFAQKSYSKLSNVPFVRGFFKKIRFRIEATNHYDEYQIRKEIVNIFYTVLGISVFLILCFAAFNPSFLFIFLVFLALYFLSGIIVDIFISRLEVKLLHQMKDYLVDLRHYFQQTKMVDEAVYTATELAKPEMKLQGNRFVEILDSTDVFQELQEYEINAPNRFLKMIISVCVLVHEKGDVVNERGSAFLNGISAITKEINYEISRRDRLGYVLKAIPIVAVSPVFLVIPIRQWAVSNFPAMEQFYSSMLGYFSQLLLYLSIFLAYVLIRKMRETSESKYVAASNKKYWEERLYEYKFVRKITQLFSPSYHQKSYHKITELLKNANSPLKIEWFYVRRLVIAVALFISIICIFIVGTRIQSNHILYKANTNVLMGQATDAEYEEAQKVTDFDRKVYFHFKEVKEKKHEDIIMYIADLKQNDPTSKEVLTAADRIYKKMTILDNSYLKWWEIMISFVVGIAGYHTPVLILIFQAFLRRLEMEEEVNQFYTIIGIISQFEKVSIEDVLEWMERVAVMFKDPIHTCLLNIDSGPEDALNQMKEEASFLPFNRLIDRLLLAESRISIKDAFDDLDIEKQFYVEQRNQHNERVINEKGWWGERIGLTPLYILIFILLVVPMLYISMTQSITLIQQIQQ